ncbi:MAG: ADP-ribosylglycohydrolase family protein [Planctomycetaceae bacterium]|nr:ADP-ribosylglycohydrolase family protein [Planctomycetaceae bacterium]
MSDDQHHRAAVTGAILGCAVGDALGLPYEGLSKRRGVRLLGEPDRHRFVFGRGMVSDDTEHTVMVAQALCTAPNDPERFAQELGRRLRWWLLGVPAGIGLATLRSIVKLWLGFGPPHSGVFSAGNGPAMRSPVLGAAIDDLDVLQRFVRASTTLTHTDPKAYHGAWVTALAAWCAKRGIDTADEFFRQYRDVVQNDSSDEFESLMTNVERSVAAGESTAAFAEQIGCGRGVSGYVYRTVPVALHAWLSHPRDYRRSVDAVIRCGGDTDTTAAIVGAIVGAGVGPNGIPQAWIDGLWEWPRTVGWMKTLAASTANAIEMSESVPAPSVFPGIGLIRNAIFFGIVLGHIARRMLPPY